jgi:hypothetical protein
MGTQAAPSAREILLKLIHTIEQSNELDSNEIREPIKKLHEAKEEGSKALQEFLRTNQDLKIGTSSVLHLIEN